MRVLFQSRTTLFSVPGGDTVQTCKTKEYLERLQIAVDISTELEPDVSTYDMVHVFNLMRPQESFLQLRNAKRYGKPTALSTIYGLYTEFEKKARIGFVGLVSSMASDYQIEYLKILARTLLNFEYNKGVRMVLMQGYYTLLKKICAYTDIFLPNSESEMKRVEAAMGIRNYRYVVVPNAVDASLFNPSVVVTAGEIAKHNNCILCVARIDGRKNQLNLVRAMKGLPYHLVLIGKPAPNHHGYYQEVLREAGNNVTVLDHIEHRRLPSYYKAARVHVLASWMETPGLASLEAAAMGCNIVITEKGDTRDYFKDYAFYCDPDDVDSIRRAILNAYAAPANNDLRQHILDNFTWERAAGKTLEGYKIVMGG